MYRFWLGPNIRIGFVAEDIPGICFGGGVTAFGLNFNMENIFTLSLEMGYLLNADIYFEDIDRGDTFQEASKTGLNNMFVAKLSILFRIRDNYIN